MPIQYLQFAPQATEFSRLGIITALPCPTCPARGKRGLNPPPPGIQEYTFLHFHCSVQLLLGEQVIATPPEACISFSMDTAQWFRSPEPIVHDRMYVVGAVAESLVAVGLNQIDCMCPGNSHFITSILREIEFELLSHPEETSLSELKYRGLLIKLAREIRRSSTEEQLKSDTKINFGRYEPTTSLS